MSFDFTSGNPANLVGGTSASMADIQGPLTDIKTFLNLRIAAIPTLVTSLPASPVDGQEIYFLADATNGVVWHFRYRSASGSAYKWEFIGGPPMTAYQNSDATRSLSTFAAIDGPAVTVPTAGDYVVRLNVHGYNASAGGFAVATIVAGGAAVTDNNAVFLYSPAVNVETTSGVERDLTLTGPAAFVAQYRSIGGGTAHFLRRNMAVIPVRIG